LEQVAADLKMKTSSFFNTPSAPSLGRIYRFFFRTVTTNFPVDISDGFHAKGAGGKPSLNLGPFEKTSPYVSY